MPLMPLYLPPGSESRPLCLLLLLLDVPKTGASTSTADTCACVGGQLASTLVTSTYGTARTLRGLTEDENLVCSLEEVQPLKPPLIT